MVAIAHLASELGILQSGADTVNLLALSVSNAENVLRIKMVFDRNFDNLIIKTSPQVHKEQQRGRLSSLPGCHANVFHRGKKLPPSCYNTWVGSR